MQSDRSLVKILAQAVSVYLVAGSICMIIFVFYQLGWNFLSYLIPAMVGVLVLLFYVVAGLRNLLRPHSNFSKGLLMAALLMQSIQLELLGFGFKNFFGPGLFIIITDTPAIRLLFSFRIFSARSVNGFNSAHNEIALAINLLPLVTLMILDKLYKPERAQEVEYEI